MPGMVDEHDLAALKDADWSDAAVWEITALASFFNFTGRLEAASSLPPDRIPEEAMMAEARDG
jgi:alkylhydroperoxidase family enzyme